MHFLGFNRYSEIKRNVRENPKGNKEIQESREMSEVVFMLPNKLQMIKNKISFLVTSLKKKNKMKNLMIDYNFVFARRLIKIIIG